MGAAPKLEAAAFQLVNTLTGQAYGLHDGFAVGRAAGDLVLSHDGSVSSRHCVFRVSNGILLVEDVGSRNGTKVNGEKIPAKTPQPLECGAKVEIGATTFEVSDPNSASAYASDKVLLATIGTQLKPDNIPAPNPANWSGAAVPRQRERDTHTITALRPTPARPKTANKSAGVSGFWFLLFGAIAAAAAYWAKFGSGS